MPGKKIKVLMFSDIYGGKNTFIHNQIKFFQEHHEIKYVATRFIKPVGDIDGFDNFEIIPFERNKLAKYFFWKLWEKDLLYYSKNKNFSRKLNLSVESYNPDIIHLHFGIEAIKFLENIKNVKARILIHFHGYDASSLLKKKSYVSKLVKFSIKHKIVFIFNCEYLKNNLLNAVKVNNKSEVIYFGSDVDFFSSNKFNIESKKNQIVFSQVSSLVRKKGHANIIKAFNLLLNQGEGDNFRFIFTGEGDEEIHLKKMISDFGLEKYFELTGLVNLNEAKQIYEKSNVFIHPSITTESGDLEGTTTSIMEAMAMKLPVLSTYHSGIPELVIDGVNGILVPENDIEKLAYAMLAISIWPRMEINRERIIEKFDIIDHNIRLENLYSEILFDN